MKKRRRNILPTEFAFDLKPPIDIAGEYSSNGINPDGGKFKCDVIIEEMGDVYTVKWFFDSKLEYSGVGIFANGLFAVSFQSRRAYGVLVYKIVGEGNLVAVWTGADTDGLGYEKLTKYEGNDQQEG